MVKLSLGYTFVIFVTGLILIVSWIWSLPDGKLKIVFCNVGQGDAIYIRFPDGRDMIVDGGPNSKILGCLGRYMPFWDRNINLVLLTHPQKDHMQGLLDIVDRFRIEYFLKAQVAGTSDGYKTLVAKLKDKNIHIHYIAKGERIKIGNVELTSLWPSASVLSTLAPGSKIPEDDVLGYSTERDVNTFSIVFSLNFGSFDAVFTGDADTEVESNYHDDLLAISDLELLKYPHHGSRTGMTSTLLHSLSPSVAVISVGNNSYGHPAEEILQLLASEGVQFKRTDKDGDVIIETDGTSWNIKNIPP